jgi:undecaprenyl diphosphate synthase
MTLPSSVTLKHIAIIMDGNARWAKAHRRPVGFGHKQGAEALRAILKPCVEHGIECLSVYAFSQENWSRPAEEVSELMTLLNLYLKREVPQLVEHGIRLHISGETSRLPAATQRAIEKALIATAGGEKLTLNICLSYGARQEITRACQAVAAKVARGELAVEEIDEAQIAAQLDTASLPELDLLIRTGGDYRISNFLLWQSAYTELYFTDILWPDFDAIALARACEAFSARERRYGGR